jgi:hypothetical protein
VGELEAWADAIFKEHPPQSPGAQQHDRPVLPERLAKKFWKLGGDTVQAPNAIGVKRDRRILLYWARFASSSFNVFIFEKPPQEAPTGFFGRRISSRVFVVEISGNRAYDNVPASEARQRPD